VRDKRSIFFLGAAVLAAGMVPLSESDLRWVPEAVAVTYVVLALLSFLDYESRRRGSLRRAASRGRAAPPPQLRAPARQCAPPQQRSTPQQYTTPQTVTATGTTGQAGETGRDRGPVIAVALGAGSALVLGALVAMLLLMIF